VVIKVPKITIELMGVESVSILADIYSEAFKNMPEQKWGVSELFELFSIRETISFVICTDAEPIGFALLRIVADEGEIITFCILPKWCNNGYATTLLGRIIDTMKIRSIKNLFLEVRENNEAAVNLYKKCSFKIISKRKKYYRNKQAEKIDALVMQYQFNK